MLLLVLKGEDAILKTRTTVGHIVHERTSGETIRDTYGDYLVENGKVTYFEPAVLAARMPKPPAPILPSGRNTRIPTAAFSTSPSLAGR